MVIVQTKILEHHNYSSLQDALNEFLRTIDDSQLKDIKFSSHGVLKDGSVEESFTAIVIYTRKIDADHETQVS